jgi:hypothetical protein
MTGNDVKDLASAPFAIEGDGENALKIYFESETSCQEYLQITPRVPTPNSVKLYRQIEQNEVTWDTVLWD